MKTAVAFLALAGAASAFAPASTRSSKNGLQAAVFDDYVGAIDFRGKEYKFDPVSRLRLLNDRTNSGHPSLNACQL